jgi:hypothetical protein
MSMMFEIKVSAVGEVRDKDGNLISSEPVETTMQVTEAEARALGYTPDEEK